MAFGGANRNGTHHFNNNMNDDGASSAVSPSTNQHRNDYTDQQSELSDYQPPEALVNIRNNQSNILGGAADQHHQVF